MSRPIPHRSTIFYFLLPLFLFLATPLTAQVFELPVAFDRWMYPFNSTPGYRAIGSTFAALGVPQFDVRDAQIVLGFDTSAVVPNPGTTLRGATLEVTVSNNDAFVYDPSFDPLASYISLPDTDPGRPIELYGVGLRNGFVGLTLDDNSTDPTLFRENSPFSPGGPNFRGVRNVFASDFAGGTARDVSNNVDLNFETEPWSIGQTDSVPPFQPVPSGTQFRFAVDLTRAHVMNYVQSGLAGGAIYLTLSSLHPTFMGGTAYPSIYLDAGGVSLGPTAVLRLTFGQAALPGDFNTDGLLDCLDIDALTGAVAAGNPDLRFDVNGDSSVNLFDVQHWIRVLKQTQLGDANLDFMVDNSDFGIWNTHKFTVGSRWCAGDFNADGVYDGSDHSIWNTYRSAGVSAIPECSGWSCLVCGFAAATWLRGRSRGRQARLGVRPCAR